MTTEPPVTTSQGKATSTALPTVARIFDGLQGRFGLSVRDSQMELAQTVRDTVFKGSGSVCCIEAPTGTGKTLGYLAGALDAQAHAGDPCPIVIATATVGLQSQIMTQDIPRLAQIGAVDPKKVVLAKGRGRYFCPHTTEMLQDKGSDAQYDLFDTGKEVAQGGVPVALDMLHAWKEGRWDGDKDSWAGEIPECWDDYCGASAQTCVNKACAHREQCPYMLSRTKMSKADVIVANHDLVLSDLAARAEEGANTVLPVKTYALVVDEAHKFPDKAVSTQKAQANLFQTDWLRDLAPYGESVSHITALSGALSRLDGVAPDVFGSFASALAGSAEALNERMLEKYPFDASGNYSWGLHVPGTRLTNQVFDMETRLAGIIKALKRSAVYFMEQAQESSGATKGRSLRRLTETNRFLKSANALHAGLHAFRSKDRLVRWAKKHPDGGVVLNAQPLEGDGVLQDLLWKAEIPVAMVSATLSVAGSFARFTKKTGLPASAVTDILPAVFDYGRGLLHQPRMMHEPGSLAYEAEVANKIERLFSKDVAAGTLVLFTSRESLQRVAGRLTGQIRECLLLQGSAPLPELVRAHKARVDAGKRSVLLGLDSMAEGLDLPGDYCNHVVITRLPFAVPSDPVEAARREELGANWFEKSYLADMLTALIQSSGRLIRRESDHGVITIMDKRMRTKPYANRALTALPEFTRSCHIRDYFDLAKEKNFEVRGACVSPFEIALAVPTATVSEVKEATAPGLHEVQTSMLAEQRKKDAHLLAKLFEDEAFQKYFDDSMTELEVFFKKSVTSACPRHEDIPAFQQKQPVLNVWGRTPKPAKRVILVGGNSGQLLKADSTAKKLHSTPVLGVSESGAVVLNQLAATSHPKLEARTSDDIYFELDSVEKSSIPGSSSDLRSKHTAKPVEVLSQRLLDMYHDEFGTQKFDENLDVLYSSAFTQI